MTGHWQHFPHDADIGVRGIGASPAEAFAAAAEAMTAAVVDPERVRPLIPVAIACTGADLEQLLFRWLNAVVYEMAVRRMLFGRFAVTIQDGTLEATATGEAVDVGRHEPAVELKGATMTALAVRRAGAAWIAECVIDV